MVSARTHVTRVGRVVALLLGATAACATVAMAGSRSSRVLRVDQFDPATSLDPNIQITQDIQRIDEMITETATKYVLTGKGHSAQYVLKPWLVSSWKQVKPKVWRFTVRPNVHFTDGERLTARAFKVQLHTIDANPTGYEKSFFRDWKSIEVVNAHTFKLTTTQPDVTVPATMTLFYIFAPGAVKKMGETAFGQHPVGTGPYEVASFRPGTSVSLKENPNYWGKEPSINKVEIRFVPSESTRVSDLLSGNADLVDGVQPVSAPQIHNAASYKTLEVAAQYNNYLLFSMFQPPLNNVYLRKAVNYAIDRQAIIHGLFRGKAGTSTQYYVPQMVGYQKGYNPYPYDLAKARAMVKRAGASAQQTIDLYYPTATGLDDEIVAAIQQQLQRIGLKVALKGAPYPVVSSEFESGSVGGMYLGGYGALTGEPAILFAYYFTTGSNYGKDVLSPEADQLVSKILKQPSQKKRVALYRTFQHDFLGKESLLVPLYRNYFIWGANKQLNWTAPSSNRYLDFQNASWK